MTAIGNPVARLASIQRKASPDSVRLSFNTFGFIGAAFTSLAAFRARKICDYFSIVRKCLDVKSL